MSRIMCRAGLSFSIAEDNSSYVQQYVSYTQIGNDKVLKSPIDNGHGTIDKMVVRSQGVLTLSARVEPEIMQIPKMSGSLYYL